MHAQPLKPVTSPPYSQQTVQCAFAYGPTLQVVEDLVEDFRLAHMNVYLGSGTPKQVPTAFGLRNLWGACYHDCWQGCETWQWRFLP